MDDNNKSETESKKGSKKSRKDKKDRRRHSGKYQFQKISKLLFFCLTPCLCEKIVLTKLCFNQVRT